MEAVKGSRTVNQIAQEYGLHPTQVGQWKKELLENAASLFESKRGPKAISAQSDPDRLYAKIGQLNMEMDWLKKSQGYACNGAAGVGEPVGILAGNKAIRASVRDALSRVCQEKASTERSQ